MYMSYSHGISICDRCPRSDDTYLLPTEKSPHFRASGSVWPSLSSQQSKVLPTVQKRDSRGQSRTACDQPRKDLAGKHDDQINVLSMYTIAWEICLGFLSCCHYIHHLFFHSCGPYLPISSTQNSRHVPLLGLISLVPIIKSSPSKPNVNDCSKWTTGRFLFPHLRCVDWCLNNNFVLLSFLAQFSCQNASLISAAHPSPLTHPWRIQWSQGPRRRIPLSWWCILHCLRYSHAQSYPEASPVNKTNPLQCIPVLSIG